MLVDVMTRNRFCKEKKNNQGKEDHGEDFLELEIASY